MRANFTGSEIQVQKNTNKTPFTIFKKLTSKIILVTLRQFDFKLCISYKIWRIPHFPVSRTNVLTVYHQVETNQLFGLIWFRPSFVDLTFYFSKVPILKGSFPCILLVLAFAPYSKLSDSYNFYWFLFKRLDRIKAVVLCNVCAITCQHLEAICL